MHAHWDNVPLAIYSALGIGSLLSLATAKRPYQIIRLARECYCRVRMLLAEFDVSKGANSPFCILVRRIRRNSPPTQTTPPAAGTGTCIYPCCTTGAYPRFCDRTFRMAINIARSVLGGNIDGPPANEVLKNVNDVYYQIHRDWLVKYIDLNEADRRAGLIKILSIHLLRGLRHDQRCQRRQKVAAFLASQLDVRATSIIPTDPPDRRSLERADIIMCDIISDAIRRVSKREGMILIYKVYAEIPDEEIARSTHLSLDTVKAHGDKSIGILGELVRKEVSKDLELLAVLRDAARREGVIILCPSTDPKTARWVRAR